MLIRAKAPLRISFAGGGTDVPPIPQQHGGCVLSATISHYAYGTLIPREDQQVNIKSLDYGLSISYNTEDRLVYDGKLDLVKAAIINMRGKNLCGFDLFIHSDAPPGSGLGASSAMMVALVGLLKEHHNLPMTDYEIAEQAYVVERKDLGIHGGMQDQYAATFGGFNYIEFLGDRVIVNPLKLSPDIINELQYSLLLCYTGQTRLSAKIIEDQMSRYDDNEANTLEAVKELKALTIEMKNVLLRRRLQEFGKLLHSEWQNKKRMSPKISNPELDGLYEVACHYGALGGKITGAGGGGYMLLFCEFDKKHIVAEQLRARGCTIADFTFDPCGLQTWRMK